MLRHPRGLSESGDVMTLRRFDGALPAVAPNGARPIAVAVVDVETTGLDRERDRVIDLGVVRLDVCPERGYPVAGTARTGEWLNDPGAPLPAHIRALTGLEDADLAGQCVDVAAVAEMIAGVDLIVAHNAAFDRAFVTRLMPALADAVWACSRDGIDWPAHGASSRALYPLALEHGFFYAGHRALIDALAVARLLGETAGDGPGTYWLDLVADAWAARVALAAVGTAFAAKDELKALGCQWDAERKHWWTTARVGAEADDLSSRMADVCRRHRGAMRSCEVPLARRYDATWRPEFRDAA